MEIKYYPLTSCQSGLFDLVGLLPSEALNLSVRINLQSAADEEKILEAMRITVKGLDYCRLRLHKKDDGTTVQYFCDDEPAGIELLDLSKLNYKKLDSEIEKLGRTPFPNKCLDVPLYNFKLIKASGERYILFFNIFHILADAYSLMHAITYFDSVYYALSAGNEIPEPKCKTHELMDAEFKFDNSGKERRHIEWLKSQFETEPHFTSINGAESHEFVKGKRYGRNQNMTQFFVGSMPMPIPSSVVSMVNEAAEQHKISPQIYYLLALRTYLATVSKTDDVTFCVTAARRATLIQKNGGLSLAHLLLNRTVFPSTLNFSDALAKMNITQNDAYRHADCHILPVEAELAKQYGTPANMQYRSVVITYQPYFPVQNVNIKFTAQYLNSGIAVYPLYINIMPNDCSGKLYAEYLYAKNYTKPESVEKFHAFMLKFLEAGIASPDKTIDELAKECL